METNHNWSNFEKNKHSKANIASKWEWTIKNFSTHDWKKFRLANMMVSIAVLNFIHSIPGVNQKTFLI